MPRMRLGVALLVPPPVQAEVDALRKACGDPALGRIPSHCTLVPPVNVRDDRMMDALDVLRAAALQMRPFTVTLGPPATFLPVNPVLYLAVGGPGLDALVALRDRVFTEPLSRPMTWPFVPHVTVADEMEPARIEAALAALADYRAEVVLDRVHLLQEGDGRVWEPIADVAFAAPAVVGRGGLPLELSVSDHLPPDAMAFDGREWPQHDLEIHGDVRWGKDPFAITARRDGAVVGTAAGWTHTTVAYVSRLMVAAEHRGEGIGSHLLAAFASLAADRGCSRLAVRTWAGTRADGFYRSRGWYEEARFSPWRYGKDFVQLRRDL